MAGDTGIRDDNRGLASGILAFIAIIVVSALLFTLFQPAAEQIFSMSTSQATDQQVRDGIALRQAIFSNILYFALFLSGITLVARAVLESRRPG